MAYFRHHLNCGRVVDRYLDRLYGFLYTLASKLKYVLLILSHESRLNAEGLKRGKAHGEHTYDKRNTRFTMTERSYRKRYCYGEDRLRGFLCPWVQMTKSAPKNGSGENIGQDEPSQLNNRVEENTTFHE